MKKNNKFWMLRFIMVGFMLVLITSCKKDNPDDNVAEPQPTTLPTITASKPDAFPLEIVALTCKNVVLNATSYTGTIGGSSVNIYAINDSLLGFMMPKIASGTQTLNINIENTDHALTFNVSEAPLISDPAAYINDYMNQFTIPNGNPDYVEIQDSLNYAMQQFNTLTADQQQEAVAFIEANRAVLDEINTSLNGHLSKTGKNDCSGEVFNTAYQKCVVSEYINCVIKLSIPVVVGGLIGATISLNPPMGGFIGGLVGIMYVKIKMKDVLLRADALWDELSTRTFAAVTAAFTSSKTLTFNNNEAKSIAFTIKIGNVQNQTYTQSWLNNFISKFNMFKNMWNQMMGSQNTPAFAPYAQETVNSDNFAFVSVQVLNNSNVTATLGGTVDNMTIKFNTTQNTEQDFEFTMTYNDGDFVAATLAIAATVIGQSPYSIAKVAGCDNQTGALGSVLATPIKVIVKNQSGDPSAGAKVNFFANNGGSVSQSLVLTDANGIASVTWTLGSTDATQTLTASAFQSNNTTPLVGSPLTFTATQMSPLIGTWEMYSGYLPAHTFSNSAETYYYDAIPETFGCHIATGHIGDFTNTNITCTSIPFTYENCINSNVYTFNQNGTFVWQISDAYQGIYSLDIDYQNCTFSNTQANPTYNTTYSGTWTFNGTSIYEQITLYNGTTINHLDTIPVNLLNSAELQTFQGGYKFNRTSK